MNDPKIILAVDDVSVLSQLDSFDTILCNLKIGKHMFTRYGPPLVTKLVNMGYNVFLDLKFHDIPNTVADAVEAAADLGVWMINMHAIGGRKMMEAARERIDNCGFDKAPMLIGVTVLTSLDADDLQEMGIMHTPASLTWALSNTAYKAGMDGVVCSALEAKTVKYASDLDNNFKLIVPGVRSAGVSVDDQKRVSTPIEAFENGAHYIVMGREIYKAPDPRQALLDVTASIS